MGILDNLLQTTVKKNKTTEVGGRGLFNIGDTQYETQYQYQDSRDMSKTILFSPTYNLNSAGASGATITTKKEASASQSQSASQSLEKPLSFAPALIGGGSTTATGEAKASSGLDLLPIVAVGGGLVLVFFYLGGGKKKK